jgi:hypothetical protein
MLFNQCISGLIATTGGRAGAGIGSPVNISFRCPRCGGDHHVAQRAA